MEQPEIQIWLPLDKPAYIGPSPNKNDVKVEIRDDVLPFPQNLESTVQRVWEKAKKNKPKLTDNPVSFLTGIQPGDNEGEHIVYVNERGYREAFVFNRDPDFHDMTDFLKHYRLLHLSTHGHIVTKPDTEGRKTLIIPPVLLYGTKRNQANQVSGFSGFPNLDEDSTVVDGVRYLDMYQTILNRLCPELNLPEEAVQNVYCVGVVYVGRKGLRGTDLDFVVEVDDSSEDVQKRFRESHQFERELHGVKFDPLSLLTYSQDLSRRDGEMSPYAMGCATAWVNAFFGRDQAEYFAREIKNINGAEITFGNSTNYLK